LSGGTDTVVRWFLSLYGNISPHLNLSREEMINVFSVVSSWLWFAGAILSSSF